LIGGLSNGMTYYFTVSASNTIGKGPQSSEVSATPSASVSSFTVKSFSSGLSFFSVPYDCSSVDLDTLFGYTGVKLAVWSPSAGSYSVSPTSPADRIRLGVGYWARFPQAVNLNAEGEPADTSQNFDIALSAGWNQIGDPFLVSIPISSLLFSSGSISGGTVSYTQATTGSPPLLLSRIWSYDALSNSYSAATDLSPGQGYWIYAVNATDMQVPHP
jgi:hypothetical protein